MAHPRRRDHPDSWHHVMNRGLAKRPVFETRRDVRQFLAVVARAVRSQELEVHAYSILTNHFHLLVRSPKGRLSSAVGWIEHQYVRYFNRSRRRDGSLFRGRFNSRSIESDTYWMTVVRYIDMNAVAAGLVTRSIDFPYCSAFHYARPSGPPWLTRELIEKRVCAASCVSVYEPSRYVDLFGEDPSETQRWLVERRLRSKQSIEDPFESLVGAAPTAVQEWMLRKLQNAEGRSRFEAIIAPELLERELNRCRAEQGAWRLGSGRWRKCAWRVLTSGLLRSVSGLSLREIGVRMGTSVATTNRDLSDHRSLLRQDERYRAVAADCVASALSSSDEKPDPGSVRIIPVRTGAWRRPRRG